MRGRDRAVVLHSACSGALAPSESGQAWTRIYFVRDSLEDWYRRLRLDMAI